MIYLLRTLRCCSLGNLRTHTIKKLGILQLLTCTHYNAGQALTGRCGEDVYVRVPLGTIVSERFHEDDMKVVSGMYCAANAALVV